MYAFGVDVPLVELMVGILVVSLIVLVEITVVLVMLMYKMRSLKRVHSDSLEMARTLVELKRLESRKK